MTPGQRRKQEWLRGLADLEPDLVVNTGDNLAHRDAVPVVTEALGPLLDRPGVFVFGSNDYYVADAAQPGRATCCPTPASGTSTSRSCPGPTSSARTSRPAGSTSPTGATRSRWAGRRSRSPASTTRTCATTGSTWSPAPPTPTPTSGSAVTHAPYLRVLDQFAADGYDAVIAGHTHGGQVCLPFVGALTTNCDLDNARAKGLHRHPADSRDGDPGSAWLHVSAGVGTSPYARIRVACRPEATLLTLTAPARLTPIRDAPAAPVWLPRLRTGRPRPAGPHRAVAQLGSAPRSGRGGRRFKSCQPDQMISPETPDSRTCASRSGCCSAGPGQVVARGGCAAPPASG